MPSVRFYFRHRGGVTLPRSVSEYPAWQTTLGKSGDLLGPSAWILQTFLHLRAMGFPCELVHELPDDGLVVAHRDELPVTLQFKAGRLLVCALADKEMPHPAAQVHILQNPFQSLRYGWKTCYIPHWPQPGLVPRDPARGALFQNIAFFGERHNLAPELHSPDFDAAIAALGLNMLEIERHEWHDYSQCDCVIAVRSFSDRTGFSTKPATKLLNAWLAGTPAILGVESAYRGAGKPGISYLEASTYTGLLGHLSALSHDPGLRESIILTGRQAAEEFSERRTALRWIEVLTREILPIHERYRRWPWVIGPMQTFAARIRDGLVYRMPFLESDFRP